MTDSAFGPSDQRQYFAEFIGTAILVFFAAGAVMMASALGNLPGPVIGGLCSGSALMILIWSLAGVSGAHLNPAFTLALWFFDGFPANRVAGYIVAQMAGSVLGSALLFGVLGQIGSMGANLPNSAIGVTPLSAFLIECFLSFVMMLVIRGSLAVAEPLRSFAAIPIGAIVGIEVMLMGAVAGAAMNPARAFGPYVFLGSWGTYWIYVLGPLIGIFAGAAGWQWLTSRPAT